MNGPDPFVRLKGSGHIQSDAKLEGPRLKESHKDAEVVYWKQGVLRERSNGFSGALRHVRN